MVDAMKEEEKTGGGALKSPQNGPRGFWRRVSGVVREKSFQVALALWILVSIAAVELSGGWNGARAYAEGSSGSLLAIILLIGIAALVTRRRPMPDLGARAPERAKALREIAGLWIYGAVVLAVGQIIGRHFFGEGIALHLNGSLVGDALGKFRVQSPTEVCTWAAYNGILLALIPYAVFRARGYSNYSLNLKSDNRWNDLFVILVVLAFSGGLDLTGPNIFRLDTHQAVVGGTLSFFLHMAGTDLPIMIFIYAILLPRYAKIARPFTAYLLGAASYPTMHIFESWTRYDSPAHGVLSVMLVYLIFFPPGLMKSFLTVRTGNAWVHLWAFHAISPHVTVDTRLIVRDFNIR
jgi:hypothetical protein